MQEVFYDVDLASDTITLVGSETTTLTPPKNEEEGATAAATAARKAPIIIDVTEEGEAIELDTEKVTVQGAPEEETEETETGEPTGEKEKELGKRTPSDKGHASSSSPYSIFAKALFEEGVLTQYDDVEFGKLEKELGNGALALLELNKRTIQDEVEAYKNSLSPIQKKILEAFDEGVDPLRFAQNQAQQLNVASITPDMLSKSEDLSRQVVMQFYLNKGFTAEEAEGEVKTIEDVGKITDRAVAVLPSLHKSLQKEEQAMLQKAKADSERIKQEQQDSLKKLKAKVDGVKQILKDVDVTPSERKKLYDMLVQPVKQDDQGRPVAAIWAKRLENPMDFDIRLAYFIDKGLFDETAPKLMGRLQTKAINEMSTLFEGERPHNAGNIAGTSPGAKRLLQALEKMPKVVAQPEKQ